MITTEASSTEPLSARVLEWTQIVLELIYTILQALWVIVVAVYRSVVPEPKKSVRGRVVLVTGAGHGLGRLLALNFSKLGARVVCWDINKEKNDAVAKEISELGGHAWSYCCDVSDENQVQEIGEKVRNDVGDVRILINNAGVLPGIPIMSLTNARIRKTMEINTLAHFWTIRKFLPNMLEVGDGHIVAVSSVAGVLGASNLTDYCASKHAVVGLMSALQEELYVKKKDDCVHLTTVCPSTMDTGLVQRPNTRFPKLFPILKVEEVADAATNAILRNKRMIILPPMCNMIYKLTSFFPCTVRSVLQHFIDYTLEPNNPLS